MSTDRIEVYRTTVRRKWRWRYVAANGNILADSGQGYVRRIDALNAAGTVVGIPELGRLQALRYDLISTVKARPPIRVVEVEK